MQISRQKLILSLFPNRLAGGLFQSGKLQREESITLETDDWAEAWSAGLTAYDSALRQLLARFRLPPSTPISVLYHSPTAIVQADDAAGSKSEAQSAAIFRIQAGEPAGLICSAHAIAPVASKKDHWMVLALSEREDTANAIFAWVTRCGGTLRAVQPAQAAIAQDAIRHVRAQDERQACCVIGQEWSAVVCGNKDGIELTRIFELGYRPLADVFSRVYEQGKALPAPDAERALFTVGIPFKSTTLPPEVRSELLPQISPIVQRFSIEIKQTLRFGLGESEMPPVLVLAGRGAAIPHLAQVLADGVDMHARAIRAERENLPKNSVFTPESSEYTFGRLPINRLAITPTPVLAERATRVFKRATVVGALAAAAIIAGEFSWLQRQSLELEPRFQALSPDIASIASERGYVEQAYEIAMRAGRTALSIHKAGTPQADIGPVLDMVAAAASETTRFNGIDFAHSQETPTVFLSGYTIAANDALVRQSLEKTIEFFEYSPLVRAVEIGAITREPDSEGSQEIRRFSVTLILEPTPRFFDQLAAFAAAQEAGE